MKRIFKGLSVLVGIVVVAIIFLLSVQAKRTANDLAPGLRDGALAACPETPNCVLSEAGTAQSQVIEPLNFSPSSPEQLGDLIAAAIVEAGGRLTPSATENYYSATFESAMFGFIDDLEIRFDPAAHTLHFRSASRVGKSDLGVNRERVETLKQSLVERSGG